MRETLTLRFSGDATHASWVLHTPLGEGGAIEHNAVADILPHAVGRRVVLLVPGAEVLLTQAKLPIRSAQKLAQAIPFALEDQLAEEVDALHFALGPRQADGTVPVAAVAKRSVEHWLGPLREHGIEPDVMIPETLALPLPDEPNTWSLMLESNQVVVRTGPFTGFACEPAALGELIQLTGPPPELGLIVHPIGAASASMLAPLPVNTTPASGSQEAISLLLEGLAATPSINLLQGALAPRQELSRWWRPWRSAAVLALTWAVLQLATQATTYVQLRHELNALQVQASTRFQATFPNIRRIVDREAQARQALAQLRQTGAGADEFLHLLNSSAEILARLPGLQVQQIEFHDGTLSLSLKGNNLQVLDTMRTQFLKYPALRLDVESANADAQGAQIRIKVRARGSKST